MNKRKKYTGIAVTFLGLLAPVLLVFTPPAYAACSPDANRGVYCCGDVQTSVDFHCNSSTGSSLTSLLLYAIDFLSAGAGIAVVVGIIYAGILYITSDGDASKTKQARDIITNAIIGLFLFIFLFAGANFLVPGGLFK